ncbi:MAG: hypothetical protein HFG34_08305 [Eubacterium sp.]|nr:hypothetical protein [Eubacterium sp.]
MLDGLFKSLIATLLISFCILTLVYCSKFIKQQKTECFNLISINFSEDLKGDFVLGTGSIKQNKYFIAYKENEDGSKKYYKMSVDQTKIYDTLEEGSTAYAEVDKNGLGITLEIRLFVPCNTITEEINLNLASDE